MHGIREIRLAELRSGTVKPIPGNKVFAKIRELLVKRPSHFFRKWKQSSLKPSATMKIVNGVSVIIFQQMG